MDHHSDSHSPLSLTSSAAEYVSARSELLAIESSEFAAHAKKSGSQLILGVTLLAIGYFVLLMGVSFGVGKFIDKTIADTPFHLFGGVGVIACVIGFAHIFIGICVLLIRKKSPSEGFFSFTRAELKKDKEWLSSNKNS